MGMSTHVYGFKLPDEKFKKMYAIAEACADADVRMPDAVKAYFGGNMPDEKGVQVTLKSTPWSGEDEDGLEIDLRTIDPDVKIIRIVNSY